MAKQELDMPGPNVPPGNLTGTYYILVAGLPWNTPWQILKDYAKDPQYDGTLNEIDRVVVYPGPTGTDGWVRVKGKINFHKVMKRLSGGTIGNKSIIADGRNEKEYTMLKSLSIPRDMNSSSQSPPTTPRHLSLLPPPPPPSYSQGYRRKSEMLQAWGSPVSQTPSYLPSYPPSNSNHSPISPVFPAPAYTPQSSPVYQLTTLVPIVSIPQPYILPPPSSAIPQYSWNPPVIQVEVRKIIITKLPQGFDEVALENFLYQILPPECAPFQVEVARHSPNGEMKCYAFVTFDDFALAQFAARIIDGVRLYGRILQAKFAKEGVPSKRYHPPRLSRVGVSTMLRSIGPIPIRNVSCQRHHINNFSNQPFSCTESATSSKASDEWLTTLANKERDVKITIPARYTATPAVVDGSAGRIASKR